MKSLVSLFSVLAVFTAAHADQTFVLTKKAENNVGIKFQIGYTAGVHTGSASDASGALLINTDGTLKSANFSVPIAAMTTGNSSRDCHMREALGIKYEGSAFPAEHVCNSANELPSSGPNSVAFPTIDFDFIGFKLNPGEQAPTKFEVGVPVVVNVQGKFRMHGVTRDMTTGANTEFFQLKVTKLSNETGAMRVQSKFDLSLKNHAVVVKPFKFGLLTISVSDKATVDLDLLVVPKP